MKFCPFCNVFQSMDTNNEEIGSADINRSIASRKEPNAIRVPDVTFVLPRTGLSRSYYAPRIPQ